MHLDPLVNLVLECCFLPYTLQNYCPDLREQETSSSAGLNEL